MIIDNPNYRILIVEDESSIREVVQTALEDADFVVETAEDAEEAKQKFGTFHPHLLLTDHDMPGMSGLELLRELRADQNYTSVIFMSGRSDNDVIVSALREGADDYIRKPFRLNELVARVEASLRMNLVHKELMEANQKLKEMVDRDYLTGLYNMRSIYDRLDVEIARARRFGRRLAVVMVDMDHFKRVNDGHDHLFGSFVIKEMGHLIGETVREVDYAARYGGDEFLIVLTEVKNAEGCEIFCERLREKVEGRKFEDGKDNIQLTVSVGYAMTGGQHEVDARQLVRSADHQLYVAKDQGRNRYVGVDLDSEPTAIRE